MGKRWTIDNIKAFADKNSESTLLTTEYCVFSQRLLLKMCLWDYLWKDTVTV